MAFIRRRVYDRADGRVAGFVQLVVLVDGEVTIGDPAIELHLAVGIVDVPHDIRIEQCHHNDAVDDAERFVAKFLLVVFPQGLGTAVAEVGAMLTLIRLRAHRLKSL